MISKALNLWHSARSNLWFTPLLYCGLYFGITIGIYSLEFHYLDDLESLPALLFSGGMEDAKSLIIALLSAMITMATLAISITVVVLSLAASQLGPRLIKTFMSDNKTKSYIGLFFGAIIACFVLAVILHDLEIKPEGFVPNYTISFVLLICFLNLFVLLGFVHHVSKSSIADNVVLAVSRDLYKSIDRLSNYEQEVGSKKDSKSWPKDFKKSCAQLFFEKSGYVQLIDYGALKKIAQEQGLKIEITFKAGYFLIKSEEGVFIRPKNKATNEVLEDIRSCFVIGSGRTPTQDLEYSIRHLVEIAIRALSPGINDSFTATNVIDHLAATMSKLFDKKMRSEFIFAEDEKTLLIKAKQNTEQDIIFSAFDQIRHDARTNPKVLNHLKRRLGVLENLSNNVVQRKALKAELSKIEEHLADI